MGYYSNVGIALSKEGYEKFIKHYNDTFSYRQNEFESDLRYYEEEKKKMNNPEHVAEDGSVFYHFPEIKWYEGAYPEIQIIMSSLFQLDEDEYLYIRLGENIDDIEERGYFYDNPFSFGIQRYLNFELPAPKEENEVDESISPK